MSKKLFTLLGLLVVFSMLLVACGGNEAPANEGPAAEEPAAEEPAAEEPAAEEPAAEEPAAEPTEEPVVRTTRVGGWLDTVSISIVDAASAVTQIVAGAADIWGFTLSSPQDINAIEEAGLGAFTSYGGNYELSFNTVGPVFEGTGKLNPFFSLKVREAMQFLIDRDYIVEEVYAGAANARFTSIATTNPEYGRYIDLIRPFEVFYSTDRAKAEALFEEGMTELGAEMVDGKWTYEGEPVVLIFIIRTDGDGTRLQIGDIVSNWLEEVGFTVDRQYKTSSEASPIWLAGNMQDGLLHMYTGGWGASGLNRDLSWSPQFYHAASSPMGSYNMWAVYADEMAEEDIAVLDDLSNQNYTTMEERREMFGKAISVGLKYNQRIFLVDTASVSPYNPALEVAGNLATGVDTNVLWPFTLRWTGEEGGVVRMIEPDLFTDPANPVDGSNWVYDSVWQIPTQSSDLIDHPHTGLSLPLRLERAEVTVQSGLPISKTLDWLTLEVVDEIAVPGDTWVDWDAETQTWITADEKFPDGLTAATKVVYYYPADMFDVVKWHDGSNLSAGDFVMNMIMTFDRSKEASAIYDASTVPAFEAFLEAFKGYKVVSADPLVIESYSDVWYNDAELIVGTQNAFWPQYGYGESQWAMIAVGNKADSKLQIAYGANKADENEIEWMNFLGGPSLEILQENLAEAAAENFIPYEPTMGEFVTADEAAARYANIQAFFEEYGHFWIGTGPYVLDDVFLTEETVTLTHNPNYPDLADRWAGFASPKVGDVAVDGPGRVVIGEEATFDVFVEFGGEAYPADEVSEVKYLLFNSSNEVVEVGVAEFVAEGQYLVTLSAETTALLESGANKLEVVGLYIPVALPSIASFEFVSE